MNRALHTATLIVLVFLALPSGANAAKDDVEFGVAKQRFLDTDDVDVILVNNTDHDIELFGGSIRDLRNDERQVRLTPKEKKLEPGAEHSWTWITDGDAGRFVATFRTSEGRFTDRFEVGAFFTVGFDGRDDSFTIFVREEKSIRQLRADLNKAQDERRIVSGIVSAPGNYNPAWSYTMGPGSIVLGDVFVEVCDASPRYVENHRRQWMGERWCPWSSYVATEGR